MTETPRAPRPALVPHTILVDHPRGRITVDGVEFPYTVMDNVEADGGAFATVTVDLVAETALVVTADGTTVIYGQPLPADEPEAPNLFDVEGD